MRVLGVLTCGLVLALAGGCRGKKGAPPQASETPSARTRPASSPGRAAPDTGSAAAHATGRAGGTAARPGAAPEKAAAPSPAPGGTLYTVQVGAFLRNGNARRFAARLQGANLPVWAHTARVKGQSFNRVRVGVTPNVAEARRLAEMLQDRFHAPVWITAVQARSDLPEGVVEATRRVLAGR